MDERVNLPNKRDRRTAAIFGATGLVGSELWKILEKDDYWDHITCIGRRQPPGLEKNNKITSMETDLFASGLYEDQLFVDTVFICLGTTMKKAGSKEAFWRIDVELPTLIAEASAKAGVKKIVAISAMGVTKDSLFFYNRAKATMEENLKQAGVEQVSFVRPGLLLGDRQESRLGEDISAKVMTSLDGLMNNRFFAKYRAIPVKTVASTMNQISQKAQMPSIVENAEMLESGTGGT